MDSESRCENCIIRQFNSLRAMSKDELKDVSAKKTTKKVKKGEALFEEGDKLKGVYCVRDGVSKLSKLSANGKDQIVKLASKGEVMGQRSVISEESANLSAIAVNDMEVCFIPKEAIVNTLHKNPDFTFEVLRHMAHDLREAETLTGRCAVLSAGRLVAEGATAEVLGRADALALFRGENAA